MPSTTRPADHSIGLRPMDRNGRPGFGVGLGGGPRLLLSRGAAYGAQSERRRGHHAGIAGTGLALTLLVQVARETVGVGARDHSERGEPDVLSAVHDPRAAHGGGG